MPRNEIDVSKEIMEKISKGEVKMRSRWYFVAGSIALVAGTVGSAVLAVFLVSLVSFSLRAHGPMGSYRLQEIISSFPWWAVVIGVAGLVGGVLLLKQYDFSYKKNYWLIVAGFVLAIIIAGIAIDYTGLSDTWLKQGPMRGYWQQMTGGQGRGMGQGNGAGYGQGRGMMRGSGTVQK